MGVEVGCDGHVGGVGGGVLVVCKRADSCVCAFEAEKSGLLID